MTVTTITSRTFNQDVGQAKRAAELGPVVITDRGEPAYVLLRHDAYQRLTRSGPDILQLLDQPGVEHIAFDPPTIGAGVFRAPDLS